MMKGQEFIAALLCPHEVIINRRYNSIQCFTKPSLDQYHWELTFPFHILCL